MPRVPGNPSATKLAERVYNSSLDKGDSKAVASRKAWSAVKKVYKKKGDKWVKK